jgi:DNA-binding transcriptional ArsR family regulator
MPLQVIENTDQLTDLVRFETSPIYELMMSLQIPLTKHKTRYADWVEEVQSAMPPRFWQELTTLYKPFFDGALFFELAIDYPNHNDVSGFLDYVRHMTPVDFMFYVVGRIIPRDEIAATGLQWKPFSEMINQVGDTFPCWCAQAPLDQIIEDVPAFQMRLANLWEWYWNDYFNRKIEDLLPHWQQGLEEKMALLARLGGLGLVEYLTGHSQLPQMLPADQAYNDFVFTPTYFITKPAYMFYGYGNITLLFDSERNMARRDEIERNKEQALDVLKALGDNSRLDILRAIAQSKGRLHGKQIAAKLNLSPSAVSRHLAQLKDAGLLSEETQDNRTITYQLQEAAINSLPEKLFEYIYH